MPDVLMLILLGLEHGLNAFARLQSGMVLHDYDLVVLESAHDAIAAVGARRLNGNVAGKHAVRREHPDRPAALVVRVLAQG
jgi:hypothetical protein